MPSRFVPTSDYPTIGEGGISMSALKTHFGDTYPTSLSEYYKGGGLVPDSAADYFPGLDGNPFPTSGKISMGIFSSKPYWDQTFLPTDTIGDGTTDYTISLPANTGYTHMACWIQGSGGSGMISNGLVSGWGNNQPAGRYSPRAGGNAGTFAIKRTTAISSGQTITVRVGAGGVPSSNGGGIVGNAYAYNAAGTTGSLGMNGDNINGQAGTTSYIKLDGADVLVVPGGARGATNSRVTWVDDLQTPPTSTRYCEPPSPDGSTVIGADAVYVGGRGGMGVSLYGVMNNYGYLQNMSWSQASNEWGFGGGVSVSYFLPNQIENGGDIPNRLSGNALRGRGTAFYTNNGNRMFSPWWSSPGGTPPSTWVYGSGLMVNASRGWTYSAGQPFVAGYGGTGVPASTFVASTRSQHNGLQAAKGGDAFVRIMFYDQNLPYHTVGNHAQLSPNSDTWT
jgi:hypothetical protein